MVALVTIGGYTWLATLAAAVAAWASRAADDSAIEQLTERLRHPIRWAVKHPVNAIRRRLGR